MTLMLYHALSSTEQTPSSFKHLHKRASSFILVASMLRTVVEQVPKTVIFCFNVPFLFTGLSSNMYKYTVS